MRSGKEVFASGSSIAGGWYSCWPCSWPVRQPWSCLACASAARQTTVSPCAELGTHWADSSNGAPGLLSLTDPLKSEGQFTGALEVSWETLRSGLKADVNCFSAYNAPKPPKTPQAGPFFSEIIPDPAPRSTRSTGVRIAFLPQLSVHAGENLRSPGSVSGRECRLRRASVDVKGVPCGVVDVV